MAINIYDVIKSVAISEKAQKENKTGEKFILTVHPEANKPMIKEAVEKLFTDVKVANVRVMIRKGKNKKVGRHKFVGSVQKKAIIKLKPGFTKPLFGTAEEQAQEIKKEQAKDKAKDKK